MLSRKLTGTLGAGFVALGIAGFAAPAHATDFEVINTNNGGAGSLRDAIESANQDPASPDAITFKIAGLRLHRIVLTGPLPMIDDNVTIDGYTQGGSVRATETTPALPTIVIDAGQVMQGLDIGGDNVVVRGLTVRDAQVDGIVIEGSNNVVAGNHIGTNAAGTAALPNGDDGVEIIGGQNNLIGGPLPEDRNVISGNPDVGVHVEGSDGHRVEGNYIGTDASGTAGLGGGDGVKLTTSNNTVVDNLISSNRTGVSVEDDGNTVQGNRIGTDVDGELGLGNFWGVVVDGGDNNLIGGAAEHQGNLVSGNLVVGVLLSADQDDPAEDNDVQGNLIGTSASGTAKLANDIGVLISEAFNNTIGGEQDGTGNVISGNETDGVRIDGEDADENQLQANWIGTDEQALLDLGNGESGVEIIEGDENRIGATLLSNDANVIAHNGKDGVTVTSGQHNAIVRNSIHDNGELGIDLAANGTTPNDGAFDNDNGPNALQNGPDVDSAHPTEIEWELETERDTDYRLEFFASDTCDPSGSGEGQTFLGFIEVRTDANGEADDTTPVTGALGQHVTMTATRLNAGGFVQSTSEFSPCELVVAP